MVAEDFERLDRCIRQTIKRRFELWFELAAYLYRLRDSGQWRTRFASFDAYLDSVGLNRTDGREMLTRYDQWQNGQLTSAIADVSFRAVRHLLSLTPEQQDAVLAAAGPDATAAELRTLADQVRAEAGAADLDQVRAEEAAVAGQPGPARERKPLDPVYCEKVLVRVLKKIDGSIDMVIADRLEKAIREVLHVVDEWRAGDVAASRAA